MTAEEARLPVTLVRQEACLRRELAHRHRLYPVWIKKRAITRQDAAQEIREMEAALHTIRLVIAGRLVPAPSEATAQPQGGGA